MADELLVIVGPTASGKTDLAVRLAEARGGEVISADSVQIYRKFEIGSGKPSTEELARAPHHLVSSIDPQEAMDAARWAELADRACAEVRQRGRVPVVCGGTFLWIRALLYGLAPAPPADEAIRARHRDLAEREGRSALHARLREVDAALAEKLAPNDLVRVSRGLEVYELTGVPLSRWQAQHGFAEPRFPFRLVGIDLPREQHDHRIAERVRTMLASGWVQEVRELLREGHSDARAMSSVGYRQIAEAIESGAPTEGELIEGPRVRGVDSLATRIYRATRVFARRQRTWLRDQPVHWLTPDQAAAGEL